MIIILIIQTILLLLLLLLLMIMNNNRLIITIIIIIIIVMCFEVQIWAAALRPRGRAPTLLIIAVLWVCLLFVSFILLLLLVLFMLLSNALVLLLLWTLWLPTPQSRQARFRARGAVSYIIERSPTSFRNACCGTLYLVCLTHTSVRYRTLFRTQIRKGDLTTQSNI